METVALHCAPAGPVEVGPVDVEPVEVGLVGGLELAEALGDGLALAEADVLGLALVVGPVDVVYVAAVYAALHCVPHAEGIENEYTSPPFSRLSEASITWISYWLPPGVVGAMM